MKARKLIWRVGPAFLLVALLPLAILDGYAARSLRSFLYRQTQRDSHNGVAPHRKRV